ncbi:hypothetical protein ACHAXT_008005 [Thalassiosira profunda]
MEAAELDLERGAVVGATAAASRDKAANKRGAFANNPLDDARNCDLAEPEGDAACALKKEEESTDDEDDLQRRPPSSLSHHNHRQTKKEETDDEDDNKPRAKVHPPPQRFVPGPPSSLLKLTTQIVAYNIEKYPPAAMGALSEPHWEDVIRARIEARNQGRGMGRDRPRFAMDGSSDKKRLPLLAERSLTPIETHPNNAHLSQCKLADEVLWREIVCYRFSGINRPASLESPCDEVKKRLCGWGQELLGLVAPPMNREEYARECKEDDLFGDDSSDEDDPSINGVIPGYLRSQSRRRSDKLDLYLRFLLSCPMDVRLLAATDIGKSVTKTVKAMKKLGKKLAEGEPFESRANNDLWGYPRFWEEMSLGRIKSTPLEMLRHILQDWKDMAAENGAVASDAPSKKRKPEDVHKPAAAIVTFGRDDKVSAEQHRIDMGLLHTAPDWRSCKVVLKRAEQSQHRKNRREAILNKSRGNRALHKQHSRSSASSAGSNGKVSKLRKETKVAASFSKSSFGASVGGFGASVARAGGGSAGTGAKRPKMQSQLHIQLAGGKSMTLPASSASRSGKAPGVFSSLQQKKAQHGSGGMAGRKR